jgi:GAF domain-containing protein
MSEEELVHTARRLAESLKPGDLEHTLSAITAAAVELLPDVTSASITVRHLDGRLDTFAQTDDDLLAVDAAQYALQSGPCYAAATDAVHVLSPDLAHDDRFPEYAAAALEYGVRAQAGLRLFDAPKASGALNLYSDRVGAFSDFQALGSLFAHQSAMALNYAREVDNLQEAVATRTGIGQAVGIVMERYGLTDEQAFAFLARLSQHRNVKLRLVAQEIIAGAEQLGSEGGEEPPRPGDG